MWIGILAAGGAALLGVGLALAKVPSVVLHGIRVLALCSMVPAVMLDVLPEATMAMGPLALVLFALGFFVPSLAAHYAPSRRTNNVLTAAFAALVIHKLLDGFALGAITGHDEHVHWNVIIAVAAHTVPMMCAMGIAFAPFGQRGVWMRALAVIAALAFGVFAGANGAPTIGVAAPALNAIAAGLLFHLLLHDLHPPPRTIEVKLAELIGALVGVVLVWVTLTSPSHDHGSPTGEHGGLYLVIWDLATMVAPWLALGLLLRTATHAAVTRWPTLATTRAMSMWQVVSPARCDVGGVPAGDNDGSAARWSFAFMFPFVAAEMLGFAFFSGMWWHVAFVVAAALCGAAVALGVSAWMRRMSTTPPTERATHQHTHHDHGHSHAAPHSHSHSHQQATPSLAPIPSAWRFAVEAMSHDAGRISLAVLLAILLLLSDQSGTSAMLGRVIGAAIIGILFAPMWWIALGTTLITSPWIAIGALTIVLAYRAYLAAPPRFGAKRIAVAAVASLLWMALMASVPTLLAPLQPTTVLVSNIALTNWRVAIAPWAVWASIGLLAVLVATSAWTHGIASWLAGLHNHPHRDIGDHWQEQ